jgi:hypothetical protein
LQQGWIVLDTTAIPKGQQPKHYLLGAGLRTGLAALAQAFYPKAYASGQQ